MLSDLNSIWKNKSLLRSLVVREIQARYSGTAGGFVWLYAQPLIMVTAYFILFDVVFDMRLPKTAATQSIGAFLVAGMLPWQAFCDSLARGSASLIDSASLIQKNAVSVPVLTARSVLASAIIFAPLFIVLLIIYKPGNALQSACAIFLIFILQTVLAVLAASLFALLAVALRDLLQIVSFLLSIGIFISPVLFPYEMYPTSWQWLLWLNPMTPFILAYQKILIVGQWPELTSFTAIGIWLSVLTIVLQVVWSRSREYIADWL